MPLREPSQSLPSWERLTVGDRFGPLSLAISRAANERYWASAGVDHPILRDGALYPPIPALRRVTAHIAEAVVRQAGADGVAPAVPGDDVRRRVAAAMWDPQYIRLVPA